MNLLQLITALPLADIEAAMADPQNLGKEATVVEDIITVAMPGLQGALVAALVNLFVTWVYAEGGGTITADPDPEVDAQTTQSRGGRNA